MRKKTPTSSRPKADQVKIGRAGRECATCATAFTSGEDHYSVLERVPEEDGFARLDYCLPCWDSALDALDTTRLHGLWRTRYPDRDGKPRTPANEYTPLLEICYDALSTEETEDEALAYLAAMVLRRQKIFRLVRTIRSDDAEQDALLFYDTVRQAEVQVPDPAVSLDHLHATRRVLQDRLAVLTPSDAPAADQDQEMAYERD